MVCGQGPGASMCPDQELPRLLNQRIYCHNTGIQPPQRPPAHKNGAAASEPAR